MSQPRLSMRKIRELLRLKYKLGRSHREIAASLGIANSTVSGYVRRASAAGFSWPLLAPVGRGHPRGDRGWWTGAPGEERDAHGLRRRPGGLELHVRGCDPEPHAAGLDDVPRPDVRVLGRGAPARDPRHREGRGAQGQPLRAGPETPTYQELATHYDVSLISATSVSTVHVVGVGVLRTYQQI